MIRLLTRALGLCNRQAKRARDDRVSCIQGILLKENNKLKNFTFLFLCKKHNNVSSHCQGVSKVTVQFWSWYTLT